VRGPILTGVSSPAAKSKRIATNFGGESPNMRLSNSEDTVMKGSSAVLWALTVVAGSAALSSCKTSVSGPPVTVEREVAGFTSIDVASGFEIELVRDSIDGLSIEAPEDALAHITSKVVDRTLHVELDGVLVGSFSPKRLIIRARSIDGISLSGGCRLTSTREIASSTMRLEESGGSRIDMRLKASRTDVASSGGSQLTLHGTTDVLSIDGISGGGTVEAFDCPARESSVDASGGSRVETRASERLTVSASGGSIVAYKGRPAITSDLSGGSRIVDAN
jgi:hypothetical protein